jgi:uncharacterized protein (TIGR02118 family)
MIRVLVLYPRSDNSTFDVDYYQQSHMPLVGKTWSQVSRWEVDLGGPDQPHHAVAHIVFPSAEAFGEAMSSPGTPAVMADVANYTNVQPQMYISEIAATS